MEICNFTRKLIVYASTLNFNGDIESVEIMAFSTTGLGNTHVIFVFCKWEAFDVLNILNL